MTDLKQIIEEVFLQGVLFGYTHSEHKEPPFQLCDEAMDDIIESYAQSPPILTREMFEVIYEKGERMGKAQMTDWDDDIDEKLEEKEKLLKKYNLTEEA